MRLKSIIIAFLMTVLTESAIADSITWKLASSWPSSLPILNRSAEYFANNVEVMSNGRMKIEIVEPTVHKQGLGIFGLVQDGEYEMGYTTSHYYKNIIPAIDFFTATPFGLTATQHYSWMTKGGGQDLMDKIFNTQGLVAMPMGNTGMQMGGWFQKEISLIEDFEGLRIRTSGMPATVLESFGASIVHLGGAGIPKAFESKEIDAAEFVGPAIDEALNLKKYAKYYYTPWHEPSVDLHLFINKEKFESVSSDLQRILKITAEASVLQSLSEALFRNAEAWDKMKQVGGFEIRTLPPEVISALRKRTEVTLSQIAEDDAQAAEVITSLLTFKEKLDAYSVISNQAYQSLN
ncbi:MAG: TRAP transporter substrate-binding protein [Pseudomonadales bacterium]